MEIKTEAEIFTDEESKSILTDESPRPRDGRDGKDGKDGRDGKNGRDGSDGKDGRDGRDGVDGKDGTKWFLFPLQVDESKGVEGDMALVQSNSNYYIRELQNERLIWKFKGNLKGKDGERGERGYNGSSFSALPSSGSNSKHFLNYYSDYNLGRISDDDDADELSMMDMGCFGDGSGTETEVDLGDFDDICEVG